MNSVLLVCVALAVLTLAVYLQVGNHQFVSFDDDIYVTNNPHTAQGLSLKNVAWAFTSVDEVTGYWLPVTFISHMTDVQLFGMNPRGHHLTNVALHICSSVLLLLLLFRTTGSLWRSSFVAALFALHPLHVESVAWVAERKDVLSACFGFLTLICYCEFAARRRTAPYLLALACFLLGLMAKPMLVTLPVVMLLLDFWPLGRYTGAEARQPLASRLAGLVSEKIPFFACAILSGLVTIYAQNRAGAMNTTDDFPALLRLENAAVSYLRYAYKTLVPADLAVLYPIPPSIPLWQVAGSLLVLAAVSLAVVRARRNRPYLLMGWCWFLVTLLPVIGLLQVGAQAWADRFSYLPLIGLFIMAAWGACDLTGQLPQRAVLLFLPAGAVVAACAALTWYQLGFWQDNVTLYRHTIAVNAAVPKIHSNLGMALSARGDLDGAIASYREALRYNPALEKTHNNLGFAYAGKGDLMSATDEYREALRINPRYTEALNNLAVALLKQGDAEGAIRQLRAALEVNPQLFDVRNNLGQVLASRGDLGAAIPEYRESLRLKPGNPSAHNNLGAALARQGDLDGAIREFREALALDPEYLNAQRNLERALAGKTR
jgi:protein O-mannosyl-transferase